MFKICRQNVSRDILFITSEISRTLNAFSCRFNIDWRKCFASVCVMALLCDMVKIQGISTQVTVYSGIPKQLYEFFIIHSV